MEGSGDEICFSSGLPLKNGFLEELGEELRKEISRKQQGDGNQAAGLWCGVPSLPVPSGKDPTCCPNLGKAKAVPRA